MTAFIVCKILADTPEGLTSITTMDGKEERYDFFIPCCDPSVFLHLTVDKGGLVTLMTLRIMCCNNY